MNVSVTKVTATAGGSLAEKTNREDTKKKNHRRILQHIHLQKSYSYYDSRYGENIRSSRGEIGIQKIINRTWAHQTYLDKDTIDILLIMSKNQTVKALGDIKVETTRESFKSHWRRARKNTAPSISGPHFGQYKISASSELISEIQTIYCHICATLVFFNP